MPVIWSTQDRTAAFLLGILSHITIFIQGEWHMFGSLLIQFYVTLTSALLIAAYYHFGDFSTAFRAVGAICSSYAAGLFISIIVYRKFFHRLRHFPGPPFAAVTKFWHVLKCREGRNHLILQELVEKYGSIIRTGPEELTIIDPAAISLIDGPNSQCTKAAWYDIFLPQVSINSTRNVEEHGLRRRVWDRGFSPAALSIYDIYIIEHAHLLAARIECLVLEHSNRVDGLDEAVVNVTEWCFWFSFDVMGEFAFARSFGMLRDSKWHAKIRQLVDAMAMLGPVSPVPWLAQIVLGLKPRLPSVNTWLSMLKWSAGCMDERLRAEIDRPDVSHWLIEAFKKGLPASDRRWLDGDAFSMVVAGSDTGAITLTFALYELARSPVQQDILFAQLRDIDTHDKVQLQACAHLNAILQETLRLHPPVPTGGYRVTPRAGLLLNGTYIPGHVTIVAPKYNIGRLESSYVRPTEFIPERWTTQPELLIDKRGFSPFGQGKFGCVGKALAMTELRLVIALLVQKFEIGFPRGDKGESLFNGLRDHFTFSLGDLHLKFAIRT
ncbi:cytochrome P450 [Xylariaceae sp. FL0255]|nr:cytochrome P450 [Xylariaceae sp. FL0255]